MAAELGEDFEEQVERLHAEVELLKSLADVTRLVSEPDPMKGTLERICGVAADALPGCEVGMSLGGEARELESGAASTERADRLDAAQRQAGEGPCLAALADRSVHEASEQELIERWPQFGRAARGEGVKSVLAFPFIVQGRSRGALNVYAFESGSLDDRARHLVSLLADQAATALDNAQLYHRSAELARNLSIAMESRGVIEQAKGIIMSRRHCTEDDAFGLMRRVSQDHNVKVRDLARDVVQWASDVRPAAALPVHLDDLIGPAVAE